jgi:chaperonin GroES
VLVQRIEAPKKSAGGILLPETNESDIQVARVVATGPGQFDERGQLQEVLVKIGQKVLLPPWGGTSVEIQDQKYFIYKDSDLLGIVED